MKHKRTQAFLKKVRWVLFIHVVGTLVSALCAGCASTGYLDNRTRDAGDIFTLTSGQNLGGKARVGPLHAGLFVGSDIGGLRGGQFRSVFREEKGPWEFSVLDIDCTLWSGEVFHVDNMPYARERGKFFWAFGWLIPLTEDPNKPPATWHSDWSYYSEIEVAAGLLFGARLGFNPGELLDFILGWTTLDIFNDDLEKRKSKQEVEQTARSGVDVSEQSARSAHP